MFCPEPASTLSPAHIIYAHDSHPDTCDGSCEAQVESCRAYLTQLGIDPAPFRVVADKGSNGDRPGFQEIIELAREKRLATVIAVSGDRFCRADAVLNFIRDLRVGGARVLLINESVDTGDSDWQDKVRMASFMQIASSAFAAKRIRYGQLARHRSGRIWVSTLPYGYTTNEVPATSDQSSRNTLKIVVVNEAEAAMVKTIFHKALDNQSLAAIAAQLNADKTPYRCRCRCRLTIGRWTGRGVRAILANAKYTGLWVWGRTRSARDCYGRRHRVKAAASDVVRINRPELRIISDDVFYRVQALLKPGNTGPDAPTSDAT